MGRARPATPRLCTPAGNNGAGVTPVPPVEVVGINSVVNPAGEYSSARGSDTSTPERRHAGVKEMLEAGITVWLLAGAMTS